MKHVRDVLNEIKWREGYELSKLKIYYSDRVEHSTKSVSGDKLRSWDKSFFYTIFDSAIPFHRVQSIQYDNLEIYAKPKTTKNQY